MKRIAKRRILYVFVLFAASLTVEAQFKEIPPAPYTQAIARQKIRILLTNANPVNRQQTAETLSGLLVWYRDLVDEELIAAWEGEQRANLPALMPLLADSRVASAIVEYSWRQQRPATFNLTHAPMLGDLMARYPDSADPFIRDLADPAVDGGKMPDLSPTEADAVCKILLDMPDTGDWKRTALQVLPHYRVAAQNLLTQDLLGSNQEKAYRAQVWTAELRLNVPANQTNQQDQRSKLISRTPSTAGPTAGRAPTGNQIPADAFPGRPHIVDQPPASIRSGDSTVYPPSAAPLAMPYSGSSSGTLKCSGPAIPPNGEYVFPGMPPGNLQIDLDGKSWDARLVPGKGQTQDLILTNKRSSPEKRCTVRWNIIP